MNELDQSGEVVKRAEDCCADDGCCSGGSSGADECCCCDSDSPGCCSESQCCGEDCCSGDGCCGDSDECCSDDCCCCEADAPDCCSRNSEAASSDDEAGTACEIVPGDSEATPPPTTGLLLLVAFLLLAPVTRAAAPTSCAPAAMAATPDGASLFVACAARPVIAVLNAKSGSLDREIALPSTATGLVLSRDGVTLFATAGSRLHALDATAGHTLWSAAVGYGAMAPALSADGTLVYVANRWAGDVVAIDVATHGERARWKAGREPVAVVPTSAGRTVLVANALPAGRSDQGAPAVEALVAGDGVRTALRLPNGSTRVEQLRLSPDGTLAVATHLLGRHYLPTTQLDRGWVETNAITLFDAVHARIIATVLLDEVDRGAANPWAAAFTSDGRRLVISHAGTHELSVIDLVALRAKVNAASGRDISGDLALLLGIRQRIALAGNGPRALAVAGNNVFAGGYFSDTIEVVDLAAGDVKPRLLHQFSSAPMTAARRGEMLFNDGTISFQGWLSCASCHSSDARTDGLNWDLLNDGIGNPKNSKSLLLAHRTPPAMSQGVREDAAAAVRAGLRYILFADRPESDAAAIDTYLRSLRPMASPLLEKGRLSPAAQRGKKVFADRKVGCATCHPAPLYTDMKSYDAGTRNASDNVKEFDTPSLVEGWRTAPYLHDGSAAGLRAVVTTANPHDRHGRTSHLTAAQIDDLVAFLSSL